MKLDLSKLGLTPSLYIEIEEKTFYGEPVILISCDGGNIDYGYVKGVIEQSLINANFEVLPAVMFGGILQLDGNRTCIKNTSLDIVKAFIMSNFV